MLDFPWPLRWANHLGPSDTTGAQQDPGMQKWAGPIREVSGEELKSAKLLEFTDDAAQLKLADFIIVAVPTPVDSAHLPDFGPLVSASETAGKNMKRGATVIYESTVYPGATAEVCVPSWRDARV